MDAHQRLGGAGVGRCDHHTPARRGGRGISEAPINTVTNSARMAATMDPLDEHDDEAQDGDYRERVIANLDAITRQTKQALSDAGINIDIFFVIPSSDSIITYGTVTDPSDEEWGSVSAIVSNIVRQSVGLDRTRCRDVVCATTDDLRQGADGVESR